MPPITQNKGTQTGAMGEGADVSEALQIFSTKGDLAHVALFLWASASSALLVWSLREQAASNQRFQDFVEEIARITRLLDG